MDSKYQRLYDKLNGNDYSSAVSNYTTTMSDVKLRLNALEGTISSSRWTEKGINLIKTSVIPALKEQASGIDTGFRSLKTACRKVANLVTRLNELDTICNNLANAQASVSNPATQAELNAIQSYTQSKQNKETQIDALIDEINDISVEFEDKSIEFTRTMTTLKEYNSFEALKAEFLGTVDDDSWYIDPAYAHKAKELLLFDNKTGEILGQGDVLHLKKGETRILTVRVPHNAGRVKQVIRTSAGGDTTYLSGHVVKCKSDINPDPNIIDYVNYRDWSGHIPEGVDLMTNYYDWIITATESGTVLISQTCEYKVEENGGTPKAMVCIKCVVDD